MKRFITLNIDNVVVSERFGTYFVEGELESNNGELGQVMQSDGTFITPTPAVTEPQETLEQKIDRLEQQRQIDNLTTFDVLATIYEELLMKG